MRTRQVAKQRRVRQQVDFGSETHQNRYGCTADTKCRRNPSGRATNLQVIEITKISMTCFIYAFRHGSGCLRFLLTFLDKTVIIQIVKPRYG